MPSENVTPKTELKLIASQEPAGLQVFLEAFFSPIAVMAWMMLIIGVMWLYCEFFVFVK